MHTDKLFTGQQKEAEAGEGLLLYNSCPEQRRRNGARFYSALTGRFISPDPFVPDPARFQSPLTGQFPSPDPFVPDPSEPMEEVRDALTVTQPPGFSDLAPAVSSPAGLREALIPNPQLLNRYAYTLNNPLKYTDPTGLCLEEGMDCSPELFTMYSICAGGSGGECTMALRETGHLEGVVQLFGSVEAFQGWVREEMRKSSYFLDVAFPANNPLQAFAENPDFDSPLAQMLFREPAAFFGGLMYAQITRYIVERQAHPPELEAVEDVISGVADWATSPTGRCVTAASAAAVAVGGCVGLKNPASCRTAPVAATMAYNACSGLF